MSHRLNCFPFLTLALEQKDVSIGMRLLRKDVRENSGLTSHLYLTSGNPFLMYACSKDFIVNILLNYYLNYEVQAQLYLTYFVG